MTKPNDLAPIPPPSSALATVPPENKVLARTFGDSIAKSPTNIQPGEAVLLDQRGGIHGRQSFARRVLAYRIAAVGAVVGGGVLMLSGAWLPGGLLYLTGVMPQLVVRYRGIDQLMAVDVLARQGNLDEAQRRLEDATRLRRRNPAAYARLAGTLAAHRGEHASALTWWRQALPKVKGIGAELLKVSMVKSLARNGEVAEARLMAETIKFPPGADRVLTGQNLLEVMLGLHATDRTPLPEVEQLHDWARAALAYSHTGVELAALGWAFERRDEPEMADFLAREARERMHYKHLATWWPELHTWLAGRAVGETDDAE